MRAGWPRSRSGDSSTTTVDARTPSGVGPYSGAVSVTSVASTGAPASGRWRHRDARTDHRRRRRPPLAERLRQLRRRRPAGPPREARARHVEHVAEVGSAELQHDPARLEALGEALDRLVGGAA